VSVRHDLLSSPAWGHDTRSLLRHPLDEGVGRITIPIGGEAGARFATADRGRRTVCRSNRSLVAVGQDSDLADLLDSLLDATNDYDVVVIESLASGYSRIKQLAPDAIIVFVDMEDHAVCQLLSMLTADPDTVDIPIVTWTKRPSLLHPPSQPRFTAVSA
jgi:hypothetical protein